MLVLYVFNNSLKLVVMIVNVEIKDGNSLIIQESVNLLKTK